MRTDNITKNFAVGFASNLIISLMKLVVRTAFIYTLGKTYLGITGLFTSVLSALSIVELGIGPAMTAALYKPLAENDVEKIKSLMAMYKKAYRIVGVVFLCIGAVLTPLLPYILKETTDLVNIYAIFALYVLNMGVSYFFFAYKSALISADQKAYLIVLRQCIAYTAMSLLMILSLVLLKGTPPLSFYVYTIIGVLTTISMNIVAARKVDKVYPYIRDKNITPLRKEDKRPIYKNIAALSLASICTVSLTAVDNIAISSLIVGGVAIVGVYANYLTIMHCVKSFVRTLSNALAPSIGNLIASEPREKTKSLFVDIDFLCFWIYGFCFVCFWVLYNPFIAGVWINDTWLLSDTAVFLVSLNFLILGFNDVVERFIQGAGLYWNVRVRYVVAAILKVALSFVFAGPLKLGVEGIFAATTIALLLTALFDPFVVFGKLFKERAWRHLFKLLWRTALLIATGALIKLACLPLVEYNFVNFLIRFAACLVVPNLLWFVIFRKTSEFAYLKDKMTTIFTGIKSKLSEKK